MRGVEATHQPKVLIIGLDGATLDLVSSWAQAGKLPTFKRLLNEGVHGELKSTIPPVTAPSWTSFMTGKNPGKHGLYHFIAPQPGSYELRYTNARSRLTKTVWQILTAAGVSVGVLNVPMTYPPEAVHGYIISGLEAPDNSAEITFPRELYQEIEQQFGQVSQQIRYLGYLTTDARRDALLQSLEAMNDHYYNMTQYLLKRYPVDVMMVVFTSTDTVQHFFWQYMDPSHPQYDASRADKYGGAICKVYQQMDDIISKLTANLPEETTVILMSDHGASPTSAREIYLNRYLAHLGLLHVHAMSQAWYHPKAWIHAAVQKADAFLKSTLTPQHKGRISRLFPQLRRTWESQSSGLSHIDWQRTKAYGYEVLTFPSGIWINLQGMRPQGTVRPGIEYEELLQFITEKLYELQDPRTGQQFIRRVYRKEEIYHGPYLDQAPDLTLAWWDGVTFVGRPSFTNSADHAVVRYVGGGPMAGGVWGGGHALAGMVCFRGQPFQPGRQVEQAEIIDLAPTLLYLLDVPIPEDMDGQVLRHAFTDAFVATHTLATRRDEASSPVGGATWDSTYADAEAQAIEQRLRGLGYIE